MSQSETIPATGAPAALSLKLKVQAFRSFRDEVTCELRPLTLLYGHNQAGKSSLLRLVALISDSLRPGTPALDLQSPSLRGASFKELGWMGRNPDLSPRLKIVASAKSSAPTLALQFVDDGGMVVNRVRLFRGAGDKFDVSFDGDVRRERDRQSARYAGSYKGTDWNGTLTFQRLLPEPDGLPEEAAEIAREVDEALEPLRRVRWLHANRLADGENLAATLSDPRYRIVLGDASDWLIAQQLGHEIAIHLDGAGKPRFVLGFSGREHLPVHLAGEGIRALLPVLLYACLAELGRKVDIAPTLLAIEEPETNLHPHLQMALFRRLLAVVHAGVPVVLETHSVYVLRAMQIAVLQGQIDPAEVGLHWVEQRPDGAATVTPVEVGADAALRGWRPQVFEQEQELAHEILDLRWKRMETP